MAPLTPADLAGLRYCDYLGGTDFYVAASPSVSCGTASAVERKVFSPACSKRTRCTAYGFQLRVSPGRTLRPHVQLRASRSVPQGRAPDRDQRGLGEPLPRPGSLDQAEGEGFEPSTDPEARNGFRDRRIRPLCHPSGPLVAVRRRRRDSNPRRRLVPP